MKKVILLFVLFLFLFCLSTDNKALGAQNPFIELTGEHWAYSAVKELNNELGLGMNFEVNTRKSLTRYEMAQIIGKIMLLQENANAKQKKLIDRLGNEFAFELKNLGVRLEKTEDYLDKTPSFSGESRLQYYDEYYTNHQLKKETLNKILNEGLSDITLADYTNRQVFFGKQAVTEDDFLDKGSLSNILRLRFLMQGNINKEWTYNARVAAYSSWQNGYTNATPGNNGELTNYQGTNGILRFDYGYLKGDYGLWKIYLGKIADTLPFAAAESVEDGGFGLNKATGLINDNYLTGVRFTYDLPKLKVNFFYGTEEEIGIYDPVTNVYSSFSMASPMAKAILYDSFTMQNEETDENTLGMRASASIWGADLGYALTPECNLYYGYMALKSGNGSWGEYGVATVNGSVINPNGEQWAKKEVKFWQSGFDYKITKKLLLSTFIGGSDASYGNKAWTVRLDYTNLASEKYDVDTEKAGSIGFYLYYQAIGRYAAWLPTYDIYSINGLGTKGWTFGINYVPWENTLLNAEYAKLSGEEAGNAFGAFADANDWASADKITVTFDYFF